MTGVWGVICLVAGLCAAIVAGRQWLVAEPGWAVWALLSAALIVIGAIAGQPWIGDEESE